MVSSSVELPANRIAFHLFRPLVYFVTLQVINITLHLNVPALVDDDNV